MKEHKHIGVYGLIIENNNIALIKKCNGPYTGKLDLPGGSFEFGETPEETLKRELKEETGIDCKEFKEVAYHVFDHVHTIMHCYVCVVDCDKDSVLLQDGETIGYKWINRAEFIDFINSNEIVPTQKRRYLEFYKEEFGI